MSRFIIGTTVYHKASHEKGVVTGVNDDGTIKVKISFTNEIECNANEVITLEELEAKNAARNAVLNRNSIEDRGFGI